MCGRYALHANPEVVALQFGLEAVPPFQLLLQLGRLRRDYSEGFAGMTTLEFWRAVYPEAPASTQTTDPSVQHAAEPETAEA